MSTGEEIQPEAEEVDELGESGEMSERTAKLILAVVAVAALGAVVAVFPYVAYFVAGILACCGWQKTAGWIAGRRSDGPTEGVQNGEETESGVAETWRVPTFHELCESLARVGTPHAHIAVLAHDLGTTPERVREALEACGVPVEAVRMQGRGSSTGVKGGSLPTPRSVVAAGQPADNDNNNTAEEGAEKGLRVERIGQAGTVVRHPADAVRHHNVRSRWGHSGNGAS